MNLERSPLARTLKRLRLRQKDLVDAGLVSRKGAWLWCEGLTRPQPARSRALLAWLQGFDRKLRMADVVTPRAK